MFNIQMWILQQQRLGGSDQYGSKRNTMHIQISPSRGRVWKLYVMKSAGGYS